MTWWQILLIILAVILVLLVVLYFVSSGYGFATDSKVHAPHEDAFCKSKGWS